MKRIANSLLLLICAAFPACTDDTAEPDYGTIEFSIVPGEGTRSSDTSPFEDECTISDLQVLVFGEDGSIDSYMDLGTGTDGTISVRTGNKTVYAVANGPSLAGCLTETELKNTDIGLEEWNRHDRGFIMSGSAACPVTKDRVSQCPVSVTRHVSRVVLRSVTNSIPAAYGNIVINGIMLTNAVAGQNLNGDMPETIWANRMGRQDEEPMVAEHIINGTSFPAGHSGCTMLLPEGLDIPAGSGREMAARLYCFPNSTASDRSGFSTSFTARYTRLVISAVVNGKQCYYPVSLPDLRRNTTYDVAMTIRHAGSDDPEEEVSPAYAEIGITAGEWTSAPDIIENL